MSLIISLVVLFIIKKNGFIREKIGLLGSILLVQLKDTSRKFIFNTKLSTQQFRAIIKVKILQEIME